MVNLKVLSDFVVGVGWLFAGFNFLGGVLSGLGWILSWFYSFCFLPEGF